MDRDGDYTALDRRREDEEWRERSALRYFVASIAIIALTIVGVVVTLVVAISTADINSVSEPFKKVQDDAIIGVLEEFDENGTWEVPEVLSNGGRILVTLSGGGGGGCTGTSAHAGGGGNAGVSAVRYPAVVRVRDTCTVTIGDGGDANVGGDATTLRCVGEDGQEHVLLTVEGGRSGCTFFNGTQQRRGAALEYPQVPERVGGRPSTGFDAERHPYGGAPGDGKAGGAGSVYGDGGDSAASDFAAGSDAGSASYGAGGGGGGKGGGAGGSGRKGFVTLIYYGDVK